MVKFDKFYTAFLHINVICGLYLMYRYLNDQENFILVTIFTLYFVIKVRNNQKS